MLNHCPFSDMNRNNLHIERSIRYHFHTFVEESSFFDLRNFNISRYGSLIVNIPYVNFIRRLEHPMALKRHRAQIANRLVYELKSIKIQIFQNERQSVKYSIVSVKDKKALQFQSISQSIERKRWREQEGKLIFGIVFAFIIFPSENGKSNKIPGKAQQNENYYISIEMLHRCVYVCDVCLFNSEHFAKTEMNGLPIPPEFVCVCVLCCTTTASRTSTVSYSNISDGMKLYATR